MGIPGLKKALVFQSLFLFQTLFAQNIFIDKPGPKDTLDDTQEFLVSITDSRASRVDFYLNERLIQARTKPPWRFTASWNTRVQNKVRFVATLADGTQLQIERTFAELVVDVEEKLEEFQFFPFLEEPGASIRLRSQGQTITPRTFERADKFPLNLVIALDISGSMKFSLRELTAGVKALLAAANGGNWRTQMLLFDESPRLLDLASMPANLEKLYIGRAKSVVWDALATGCQLFPKEQRRVLVLVSDGYDDGSRHDAASVEQYLRRSNASLIWISPSDLQVPNLNRLTEHSGGYTAFTSKGDPWQKLIFLLENQYHLLAPDALFPVELDPSRGQAWYPRWPATLAKP